jgi:hypothetical protein
VRQFRSLSGRNKPADGETIFLVRRRCLETSGAYLCDGDLTTRFGHVVAYQRSLPGILPGPSRRDAQVSARPLTATSESQAGATTLEGYMPEMMHYRYQAEQAKRLAKQVSDPEVRARLVEMSVEYSRYAALIEIRASERFAAH